MKYQNPQYHIYLPLNTENPSTLGESWFFKGKFWKLQVMLGYTWSDLDCTKSGISLFNVRSKERVEKLKTKLENWGIKFKTDVSDAGWSYRFGFSGSKKNLELIDKLYEEHIKNQMIGREEWKRKNGSLVRPDYFENYCKGEID